MSIEYFQGTKGKKNKINLNDTVVVSFEVVKHTVNMIATYYKVGDEIAERNYVDCANLLDFYLNKQTPTGKVVGYGAEDDDFDGKSNILVKINGRYGVMHLFLSESKLKRKRSFKEIRKSVERTIKRKPTKKQLKELKETFESFGKSKELKQ